MNNIKHALLQDSDREVKTSQVVDTGEKGHGGCH